MSNRTLLYPRALTAQGTDQVQSLFSYLQHLALAHQMKPRALLETLFEAFPTEQATDIPSVLKQQRIHGFASLSEDLKERLEAATGSSLTGANLAKYSQVLAPTNLTRTGQVYCPCCVQEDKDLPYIRLLWQVQCVTVCPIHKVKLRDASTCNAEVADRLPPQRRPSLGGVCSKCGSVGYRCVGEAPEAASKEEVWVAEQVARLLAAPEQLAGTFTPATLQSGLRALVQGAYHGSVVRASGEAGLSRASVCTWTQGATPALPWLLQLCFHAGADVLALLAGSFEVLPDAWTTGRRHDVLVRPYKLTDVEPDSVREALVSAAASPNPPSLREFARRHDMHIDMPRRRFPNEARALSAAHQQHLKRLREDQYLAAVAAYTRAAEEIWLRGRTVHVGVLQRESGMVAFSQNEPRVRALKEVVSKFRTPQVQSRRART